MAGIGFELKRIFRGNKGYFYGIKAYAYSSLVTVGPMLLCMLMMVVMQQLMVIADETYLEKEIFLATSEYAFVFSLLITSGFTMLISRYIADRLYVKEYDDILPSFYGVASLCLVLGGAAGAIFLCRSPLDAWYKLCAYLLLMELIILWLLAVYISALKDYMRIVRSFFIGAALSVAVACLFLFACAWTKATAVVLAMDCGFLVTLILLAVHLESRFKSGRKSYYAFLPYLLKYPSLFAIGLFSTLGIYVHNMMFWGSKLGITVAGTFVYAPAYDVPVFYAFLTTIPTMVIFVVSMETLFYDKYKLYFSTVLNSGTLQEIMRAKQDMLQVLFQELIFLLEIQLFFTVCSLAAGNKFLPKIGFSAEEADTFNILVLGDFLYIVMFVLVLILLYFDDRKGTLIITGSFLFCNVLLASLGAFGDSCGFSFFLSALTALLVSLARLFHIVDNINYYTFCSQPLVSKERDQALLRFIRRMMKRQTAAFKAIGSGGWK